MRVTTLPAHAVAKAVATTTRPPFSVVVVTFNTMKTNAMCLTSVLRHLGPADELIVVDNASTDETTAYLRSITDRRVRVVLNTENKGYSIAMNQGLRLAHGEHVVLLNPDTAVPPSWLERMRAHFRDPRVAAVGPITDRAGGCQRFEFYAPPGLKGSFSVDDLGERIHAANTGKGLEAKTLIGFCMMVSRQAMEAVGMLDEELVLGNDDLEYCLRLREAGFKVLVATDVFVHHEEQVSFRTLPSEETRRKVQESTDALARKLLARYGTGNVPSGRELFGVDWFKPSFDLWEGGAGSSSEAIVRRPLNEFMRDEESRAYIHPEGESFDYTDGQEVEQRIYDCIRKARDRSVFSEELEGMITDWPSMYHFTPMRHNLLRHIELRAGEDVLELGCGCGAITRQLGETGANVVAVEGGPMRAKCAALRCKDLDNVKVYCSDFQKPVFDRLFDTVLLIGVLEYSPAFFDPENPLRACLDLVRGVLKPGGRLIVAIENRNGLKYLAGQSEDHLGKPYVGVENLYGKKTAQTLGRRELLALLLSAGFEGIEFNYPFPDYKLPRVVLTQEAFDDPVFQPAEILRQLRSKDYGADRAPAFRDVLVWPQIAANGLAPDLANSFLVIATPERRDPSPSKSLLGAFYSLDRLPGLKTRTRFVRGPNGAISVAKEPLQIDGVVAPSRRENKEFDWVCESAAYQPGAHFASEVVRRALSGDVDGFCDLMRCWVDFVRAEGLADPSDQSWTTKVEPEFFDCIPRNLVVGEAGLAFIDREWRYKGGQSLRALIVRGLVYLLHDHPELSAGASLFKVLVSELGLPIDGRLVDELVAAETAVYLFVSGQAHNVREFFESYIGKQ